MSFQKQFEDLLKQVHDLEKAIIAMKESVEEIVIPSVSEPEKLEIPPSVENTSLPENKVFLSDVITKEKMTDFRKSLALNERFMFQREIFQNNADSMNQALETLSTFDNLGDALNYLDSSFPIQWESEAGAIFRGLLEKRFI
jgi:hypothetical protein